MFLKYSDQHLMSSVLNIFYHLLSVLALSIPQEHKKMESDLFMEYDEVSTFIDKNLFPFQLLRRNSLVKHKRFIKHSD